MVTPTAIGGDHPAQAVTAALRITVTPGHFDVAVDHHRITVRRPDRDVAAPAEADHARFGGHGHQRRGEGGVHGVAAVATDRQPGVQGLSAGRGDGDAGSGHSAILAQSCAADPVSSHVFHHIGQLAWLVNLEWSPAEWCTST